MLGSSSLGHSRVQIKAPSQSAAGIQIHTEKRFGMTNVSVVTRGLPGTLACSAEHAPWPSAVCALTTVLAELGSTASPNPGSPGRTCLSFLGAVYPSWS